MDPVEAFTKQPLPKEAVFPKAEYEERLKKVRAAMREGGLDMLVCHNMPNICWLSGYQTPMADWYNCLIVPADGELTLQICDVALGVVNSHTVANFAWVRWDTMSGEATRQLVKLLQEHGIDGKRVGLEMRRPGLDPYTHAELQKAFPRTDFVDATMLVLKQRAVKSPAEIECLRKAAKMSVAGMKAALAAVKLDATENTVVAAATEAMFQAGSEFLSINPLIRSGPRSAMTHGMFNRTPINPGDSVVLEFGAVYGRYTAPIYRTAVVGKPPDRLRRLVDTALSTLEILYANIKPGRTVDDVSRPAMEHMKKSEKNEPDADYNHNQAYSVGIGFPPDWVEHSIFIRPGHQDVLKPGMTFHTPRSFRIPNLMSVGFSETILVTESGCEPITQGHPRQLYIG